MRPVYWLMLAIPLTVGCGVEEDRVQALEQEVATLKQKLTATSTVTDCMQLRIQAMRAWSKHRPEWTACKKQGSKCKNTGLPPNTIQKYRRRLSKMFESLNRADFEGANGHLSKLNFPVPEVNRWYEKQEFTKEEWIAGRDNAHGLTTRFISECAAVLSVSTAGGDPAHESESGESATAGDSMTNP